MSLPKNRGSTMNSRSRTKGPARAKLGRDPVSRETRAEVVPLRTTTPRRRRRVMKTSELIARDIVLDIAQRGLKSGDSLPPEASMLQHYEVGRASLREALRLLEVNGLVYIRAGAKGGPVVGEADSEHLARMLALYFGLTGATYEDLTDVMLLVYPLVAEVVARRKLGKAESDALRNSVAESCGDANSRMSRTEILKDFH